MVQPDAPVPLEQQVSLEGPFLNLPMETTAEANARHSRLLNRPEN